MRTKILFVMPSLGSGGAEKSFVSMLSLLPRDKFDIYVMIVKEGGLFYQLLPTNVVYVNAPKNLKIALSSIHSKFMKKDCSWKDKLLKILSNVIVRCRKLTGLGLLQLTWKMWKSNISILESQFDVAVSFMDGMTNYYVIDKVQARKKILWVHNDYNKIKTNIQYEYQYFSKANYVITISDICVASLQENFPEISNKFLCIENISSSKMINSMAKDFIPEEYKGKENIVKILSIGRLAPQKGFDMAINAASILKKQGLNFQWYIIGRGALRIGLEKQIKQLNLEDNVYLLGERNNPYPYILYCDIILQTSRYEGKSIVLDEAKILHKPIIVTRYPSVVDNINSGITGIICEMNPESISNAIYMLYRNPELQKTLKSNLELNFNGNESEINKYVNIFQ